MVLPTTRGHHAGHDAGTRETFLRQPSAILMCNILKDISSYRVPTGRYDIIICMETHGITTSLMLTGRIRHSLHTERHNIECYDSMITVCMLLICRHIHSEALPVLS